MRVLYVLLRASIRKESLYFELRTGNEDESVERATEGKYKEGECFTL